MSGLSCIAMRDRNLGAVSHCKSGFLLRNINGIWCYPSRTHVLEEAAVGCSNRALGAQRNGLCFFARPAALLRWPGCGSHSRFWASSDEHSLIPLKDESKAASSSSYTMRAALRPCPGRWLRLSVSLCPSRSLRPGRTGAVSCRRGLASRRLQGLCWQRGLPHFCSQLQKLFFSPAPWLPHCGVRAPTALPCPGPSTFPAALPPSLVRYEWALSKRGDEA